MKLINYRKNIFYGFIFAIISALFIYFVFIPANNKINTDFPNYYVSSNMYLDGINLKTAYDNVEFNRQLQLYGINDQIVSFVPYPPLTSLLMLPIAKLPPLDAKYVWNIFNLLLMLGSIIILSRISSINIFAIGIIFFLSGFAVMNNFMFAQTYLLILLLLCMSMYFMLKGKDILSALFISLSIVLKFYTIFFIFLFIFTKRYKLLVYTVILFVLIYIPVVLLTGFDLNVFYFTKIMPRLGDGWVGTVYAAEYQSFTSLLHRWFDFEPMLNPLPVLQSTLLFYILKYVYIFSVLTFSVLFIKPAKENLKLSLSLFCIVSMLLLPVNASYQYVILIPAVVFLVEYFTGSKKYFTAGTIIAVIFLINSPLQVWITMRFKDTPFYILAYVKLYGLFFLWIVNLKVLGKLNDIVFFNARTRKFFAIASVHIVLLSALSYYTNPPLTDNAAFIKTGDNFLISMPSASRDKLIWTECISEKFVIRSNFGYSYDKENVFYPVFTDSGHIAFETIENRIPKQKIIDIKTGIQRDASGMKFNTHSLNNNNNLECYQIDGIISIKDLLTGKNYPLTSGKQICSFPVFEDNNTVIFCSDRNRGVGFTALYRMRVPLVKEDLGGSKINTDHLFWVSDKSADQ